MLFDVSKPTIFVHQSRRDFVFVNAERCLVHSSRASHRLPYFAEILDIMSNNNAFYEERQLVMLLIDQLIWNILPDIISIVNEEEHLNSRANCVPSGAIKQDIMK